MSSKALMFKGTIAWVPQHNISTHSLHEGEEKVAHLPFRLNRYHIKL